MLNVRFPPKADIQRSSASACYGRGRQQGARNELIASRAHIQGAIDLNFIAKLVSTET
jgi:hypothetical protein